MALVLRHPDGQQVVTVLPIYLLDSLHIVSTSPVSLLLELHGSFCVGDRAVLLIPVVVLHQGGNAVGVHQDVTAEEGGLDNQRTTVDGLRLITFM